MSVSLRLRVTSRDVAATKFTWRDAPFRPRSLAFAWTQEPARRLPPTQDCSAMRTCLSGGDGRACFISSGAGRPRQRPGQTRRATAMTPGLDCQHRRHRLRTHRAVHLRQPRLLEHQPNQEHVLATLHFLFKSCRTSTASSTTSTTSRPASRSSIAKSPPSTPPFFYAASSPPALLQRPRNSRSRHATLQSRRLALDAQRRQDLLHGLAARNRLSRLAGTTTAN